MRFSVRDSLQPHGSPLMDAHTTGHSPDGFRATDSPGERRQEMNLNLGCADRHVSGEGWVNVDIYPPADQIADLTLPWPWPTGSIEQVQADDIIEHLPDRIHTMNELHRILVPGGKATIIVPSASHGAGFAQDPTHKSLWTMNSFQYYQHESFAVGRLAGSYGITARFKILEIEETKYMDAYEEVWKIRVVLEAVK